MFIITLLNADTGKEVTVVIVEFSPHSLALQLWHVSRLSGVLLCICSQYSAFECRRAHGSTVGQAVCSNCKQAQCPLTTEHSGRESQSEAIGTDGTQSRNQTDRPSAAIDSSIQFLYLTQLSPELFHKWHSSRCTALVTENNRKAKN